MKRVLSCLLAVCLLLGLCAFGAAAEGETAVTVADITWGGANQPKPGAKVVFSVHLNNGGTADLAKGTAVKVDLYVNQEKVFTETYDKGIAAGQTVQVKFPKWEAVAGEHVVTAVLNECKADRENWTQKQHLTANIRVADKALEVPAVAEKFGMTELTFSDDFTTLNLVDKECTGAYGYKWYANIPYGAKDAEPTDYELTDVGINLKRVPTHFGWTLCTFDCATGAGWGYVHGYMEMRVRTPANRISGDRGQPSVWSLPPEKILSFSGANRYVETDFLEFLDDDSFTTTLHDLHFVDDDQREYVHHYKNSNYKNLGMRDGEWHTLGFVRQNGVMRCYLDGKEYMTTTWKDDAKSYPEALIMKGEKDGIDAFSIVDDQLTPLIINGAEGWPLEIDYIHVWEGKPESNQGESVETAQFVDMYLRDGDGQIELTANFENYEALIEVEEAVAELGATQQEELNRLAKREVGKTMAQVIEDAKQFKADMETFAAAFAVDSEGAVLDAESVEACKVIVKGERKWNKMSAELKEAVNNHVYLNNGVTYEDLLAAAREKVPASPIKPWMIAVAAVVLAAAVAAVAVGVCRKKAKG